MIKITGSKTTETKSDLLKNLILKVKGAEKSYVVIGVNEGAGSYPGPNPPLVAQVALWNEFGTATIPERSFLRSAMDDNATLIEKWRLEVIENIIFKGWTIQKALEAMGFRIQTLIQNKIKSDVPPPNAASTKAAKSRAGVADQTLINTGLLLRSITYKVVVEK